MCMLFIVHYRFGLPEALNFERMTEDEKEQQRELSSDEEDFFSSSLTSKRSQGAGEPDGYHACVSDKLNLLHSFPLIKRFSPKLNTGLPASATCERHFRCAGLLFTAKRARIDSIHLEN